VVVRGRRRGYKEKVSNKGKKEMSIQGIHRYDYQKEL